MECWISKGVFNLSFELIKNFSSLVPFLNVLRGGSKAIGLGPQICWAIETSEAELAVKKKNLNGSLNSLGRVLKPDQFELGWGDWGRSFSFFIFSPWFSPGGIVFWAAKQKKKQFRFHPLPFPVFFIFFGPSDIYKLALGP